MAIIILVLSMLSTLVVHGNALLTTASGNMDVVETELPRNGLFTTNWWKVGKPDFAGDNSRRMQHAMSAIDMSAGTVLMYGGMKSTSNNILSDAYIYTSSSSIAIGGTWAKVKEGPGRRYGHSMSSLSDGTVLMHGGMTVLGSSGADPRTYYFSDAYIYSPVLNNWTRVADAPIARRYHSSSPLTGGRVLIYGGVGDNDADLNDAYIYTQGTGTWTRVTDGPSVRHGHATSPLDGRRVLMYGGTHDGKYLNDTYIYDMDGDNDKEAKGGGGGGGGTWTRVADGPSQFAPPGPPYTVWCGREQHTMTALDGRVLMYGGIYNSAYRLNDTYIYTPSSYGKGISVGGKWTKLADGPGARNNHASASLPNGRVLMYGGKEDVTSVWLPNTLNDTWIYESESPVPAICCQAKSPDHKTTCATFVDPTSCDDYSKGFGDFCSWKC